ncbi:hypothetical protein [sulfur-oxidizing endosymbiont of Gigantopelta aegis]|uniref:hypothetical protein n=1 Tax=sulfur-oxidizing endosymbiont of Gigantopelta aegis TaxID=2794934 RepID=UPI001FEC66F6|nr:hypothetical protein [sulfur-oxidizing endosymbiont of Gigantopelta aegis]
MSLNNKKGHILLGISVVFLSMSMQTAIASDDDDSNKKKFSIKEAKWDDEKSRIKIKGKGRNGKEVIVYNASSNAVIGSDEVDDKKWKVKEYNLTSVPCRIKAVQSDGSSAEKKVKNAPSDCDDGNGGTPPPGNPLGNFTILAANDLGMHCADQDFRIFSILPPYNVINAQVLKKGKEPQMMSPIDGIHVTYKAVNSNYFSDLTDSNRPPDASDSFTSTGYNLPGIFKNNFWDTVPPSSTGIDKIGFIAYEALYPTDILALFPSTPDLGLPAPDVEKLYILGLGLHAEQSAMPGSLNEPQPFNGFVETYPFFVNFPFGYTINNYKRYTAEGVPISAVDDNGRSNPYPLMRIEARDASNNVLASVDAVVPVASEADCAICHASQNICDHDTSNTLVCDNIANDNYLQDVNFVTDANMVIGTTVEQQVINSAKINIVRLHDFKYQTAIAGTAADGTNGDGTSPNIVCANCHYSPALDLAHLGPTNENGKEQENHISMSRAMHSVHGSLPQTDPNSYGHLFPIMPPPGLNRDPLLAEETLMETCYNCHPGKRAKCLRGAMGGSGTVCQDCHGQMTQVGDDFTENFPIAGFPAGADLSKRVSWASEPACDSCHVGDVMEVEQLKQSGSLNDTVMNTIDSANNPDGLRLLMSYRLSDHKSNGGPDDLSIFKFPDSRFATTEGLYRLSGADNGSGKGHGGLSCEGCHGSTHAIWPNKNPFANDNKAAMDLQGHTGAIIECTTCHEGDLGVTLEGPHGMHPVGDTRFSDGGHEDLAEKNGDSCRACHGLAGEGSVLSRAATNRTLSNEGKTINLKKGDVVTCSLCHDNELAPGKN